MAGICLRRIDGNAGNGAVSQDGEKEKMIVAYSIIAHFSLSTLFFYPPCPGASLGTIISAIPSSPALGSVVQKVK
jgi:hypothetical protein